MTVFSKLRVCASIATSTAAPQSALLVSRPIRTRVIRWPSRISQAIGCGRHVLRFRTLSTAPQTADDFAEETTTLLTRTAVRRMRVAQLRDELTIRGIDSQGTKPHLVDRLLGELDRTPKEKAPDTSQLVEEEGEFLNETPITPLNPERSYIVRVRSAPSGKRCIVEGVGIGMTLLEVNPDDTHNPAVLESNQLLLPGQRSPFEANYCALIMAMRYTQSRGVQNLIMEIDDLGIVRQIIGEGRIGPGYQQELHQKALQLKQSFQCFEVRHQNGTPAADTEVLAKTALAKQRQMESDWPMVDPILTQSTNAGIASIPIQPDKEYLLQFDGGSRGNPGIAGTGMVLFEPDGQQEIWCGWRFLGETGYTNNVAEYMSLIEGLECAKKIGIRRIHAQGDSQLIVKQVRGEYRVKKESLQPLHRRVKELSSGFESFRVEYIPRASNKRADWLANHGMDERTCCGANALE